MFHIIIIITENLIGNISNALPDPPFLQEDGGYIPAADMAALMNGEVPPTNSSSASGGQAAAVPTVVTSSGVPLVTAPPQRTMQLLTTDEDTLD